MMKKISMIVLGVIIAMSSIFTADVAEASKANTARNMTQYTNIVNKNLLNLEKNFTVTYVGNKNTIYKSLNNTIPNAIKKNPLIKANVKTYKYSGRTHANKVVVKYSMTYYATKSQERYAKVKAKSIAKNIMKKNKGQFNRVKAVNDYLVAKTQYGGRTDARYTSYGLLKNNIAVCQAYAITTYRILKEMKIPVRYVTGYSNNQHHGWNKVRISGKWYNLDVTWNDTSSNSRYKKSYKYFLLTDAQLRKTHSWNNKALPKATSKKYSFFNKTSSVLKRGNMIYYANDKKNQRLYSFNIKTGKHKKVTNTRVQNLVYFKGKIYFSNYSQDGRLAKMNLNGKKQKNLNKRFTNHLHVKGNRLIYKTNNTYYYRHS